MHIEIRDYRGVERADIDLSQIASLAGGVTPRKLAIYSFQRRSWSPPRKKTLLEPVVSDPKLVGMNCSRSRRVNG